MQPKNNLVSLDLGYLLNNTEQAKFPLISYFLFNLCQGRLYLQTRRCSPAPIRINCSLDSDRPCAHQNQGCNAPAAAALCRKPSRCWLSLTSLISIFNLKCCCRLYGGRERTTQIFFFCTYSRRAKSGPL